MGDRLRGESTVKNVEAIDIKMVRQQARDNLQSALSVYYRLCQMEADMAEGAMRNVLVQDILDDVETLIVTLLKIREDVAQLKLQGVNC